MWIVECAERFIHSVSVALAAREIHSSLLFQSATHFLQTLFNMSSQGYLTFTLHQSDSERTLFKCVCACVCSASVEKRLDYLCTGIYIFFHVRPHERIFLSYGNL